MTIYTVINSATNAPQPDTNSVSVTFRLWKHGIDAIKLLLVRYFPVRILVHPVGYSSQLNSIFVGSGHSAIVLCPSIGGKAK